CHHAAPAAQPARGAHPLGQRIVAIEEERNVVTLGCGASTALLEDRHHALEPDREAARGDVVAEEPAHHPVVAAATRDRGRAAAVDRLEDGAGVVTHAAHEARV